MWSVGRGDTSERRSENPGLARRLFEAKSLDEMAMVPKLVVYILLGLSISSSCFRFTGSW